VLCKQAQERHKLQETVFQKLEEEQKRAHKDVYWNFILVWLLINAAAQMVMRWAAIQEKLGD
jgi:glutathione peroxidase-family protein